MKKVGTETQLKKQVLEWLNYQSGVFAWSSGTGTFFIKDKGKTRCFRAGIKGMSDILGIIKGGVFLAIELKVKYNQPTIDQKMFLEKIKGLGGIGIVAHSLDEVIAYLKDYL